MSGVSRLTLVAALLSVASIARAEDPPGLALAKQLVEAQRGDAHREKMRVVWPDDVEAAPPEGAEVVVITGYASFALTRLVWREGKVEARAAYTARTWFYNPDGEDFSTWTFDVEPAAFATAWTAARSIAGARDERLVPKPPRNLPEGWVVGTGSHESREYVRLRLAGADEPVHVGDPRGSHRSSEEGINDWGDIRDRSVFRAFDALLPKSLADVRASSDLLVWADVLGQEFHRAAAHLDLSWRGKQDCLLEVALRIAGEAGDVATMAAVETLEASLRPEAGRERTEDTVRDRLLTELAAARTRMQLRLHWDAAHARSLLTQERQKTNLGVDLQSWIRRRYREAEPAGYLGLLEEQRGRGIEAGAADLARTLDGVRTTGATVSVETLRAYLDAPDADTQVAAARAVLAVAPEDAKATVAILTTLFAVSVAPDQSGRTIRWARIDALDGALEHGLVGAAELRRLLREATSTHGLLVRAVLDGLRRTSEPPTAEETLAAWRRTLEQGAGIEFAAEALVDLKDTASRAQIAEALERLRVGRPYQRSRYRVDVDRLLRRLEAEMPEPAAPAPCPPPVRDSEPSPR